MTFYHFLEKLWLDENSIKSFINLVSNKIELIRYISLTNMGARSVLVKTLLEAYDTINDGKDRNVIIGYHDCIHNYLDKIIR